VNKQVTLSKRTVSLVLSLLLVFGGGYVLGQRHPTASAQGDPVDFSLFWDAWNIVNKESVQDPAKTQQDRIYGAISGMVAGLGDPFSMYLKPDDAKQFNDDINGNFEGIGAELEYKNNAITIVAPLESSPAEKAGLKADDIIVKINDKDAPTSLQDAVNQIRGEAGTSVKLTVLRDGDVHDFSITRAKVDVASVTYKLQGTTGIIKINQFNANTTQQLDDAIAKLKADNAKSLVLDLRNNPGGLLDQAIEMTSRFIDPGVVVIQKDRAGNEEAMQTVSVSNHVDVPMVVLVNKGSASASEIMSGAIQDAGRAKLVGTVTYGKGSVQTIERLKDGSAVRVTVAEWLTPKKRAINKVGITPDVQIDLSDADAKAGKDPQMAKALELLK
jgi:carboxyl-terminal processing protease